MERYKKEYSSKWQNQYTEGFNRAVCEDYLRGDLSRRQVEKKYNLGNSRLTIWLKEFGYEVRKVCFVALPAMSDLEKEALSPSDTASKQLKQQLADALLLAESYRRMIEQAELELKINIRKKSSTK